MRRHLGFTMIEMVVIMALMGILSAVAIPRLSGNIGRDTQSVDNLMANCRYAQQVAIQTKTPIQMHLSDCDKSSKKSCLFWKTQQDDKTWVTLDSPEYGDEIGLHWVLTVSSKNWSGLPLTFTPHGQILWAERDDEEKLCWLVGQQYVCFVSETGLIYVTNSLES